MLSDDWNEYAHGFQNEILALLPCRQKMHHNLNVTRESKVEVQSANEREQSTSQHLSLARLSKERQLLQKSF